METTVPLSKGGTGNAEDQNGEPLIRYTPDDAKIAELRSQYMVFEGGKWNSKFKADDPDGYEQCKLALKTLIPLRTGIEATRKALKEESLNWGRKVDGAARALTAKLLEIEVPIHAEKKKVDDAREAEARKIVEAEQARIAALEQAAKDAEAARLRAVRDAEEAKLAEERRQIALERQRMEEERRKQGEEYAAKIKVEREIREAEDAERRERQKAAEELQRLAQMKLDQERARLQAMKDEVERAEREAHERKRREEFEAQAQQRAREQADREQLERIRLADEKAENERQLAIREAEAKPDMEKIRAFGKLLDEIKPPSTKHQPAQEFLLGIMADIEKLAARCKAYRFGGSK